MGRWATPPLAPASCLPISHGPPLPGRCYPPLLSTPRGRRTWSGGGSANSGASLMSPVVEYFCIDVSWLYYKDRCYQKAKSILRVAFQGRNFFLRRPPFPESVAHFFYQIIICLPLKGTPLRGRKR